MKRMLLLLLVLLSGTQIGFGKEMIPNIYLLTDQVDASLGSNEAVFSFTVGNQLEMNINKPYKKPTVSLSLNGVWKTVDLNATKSFELKVEPGKYTFQFFLDEFHDEIYSGEIAIEPKHKSSYQLTFSRTEEYPNLTEKPVIYCYGPLDTPLDITVTPVGVISFTYPKTDGKWSGKVGESGGFEVNGTTYPYLFWEAEQSPESMRVNWEKSSVIKGSETINYLETVCSKLGFTATEKTDFITYWGPRLAQNETVEVCVLTENVSELIGELTVSDPSFQVHRMFLVFRKTENTDLRKNLENLEKFDRSSNHILEWGGSECQAAVF